MDGRARRLSFRSRRTAGAVACVAVLLGVDVVATAAPGATLSPTVDISCQATDATGATFTDLQAAIDAASGVAMIDVSGTCTGNFAIPGNGSATDLSLIGPATLDGGASGTVLTVTSTATLKSLTIQDGNAPVVGGVARGGGIFNTGQLSLEQTTVTNNTAYNGFDGLGAGIYNTGTLSLDDSSISDNTSGGRFGTAGGISNSGTATLHDSSVTDNHGSGGPGGGINSNGASVSLDHSAVTGNFGRSGGGIYLSGGSLTVAASTVSNNRAGQGNGGGIELRGGSATVTGSTVSGNSSFIGTQGTVGGIFGDGLVEVSASIVASNPGGDCSGVIDGGYNLADASDSLCGLSSAPHDVSGDPLLGPLADNGGPTFTMALGIGSAAIGQVPTTSGLCGATDQRGLPRKSPNCDIGAFEIQRQVQSIAWLTPPPSVATYGQSFPVVAAATSGLPVSISAAGPCSYSAGTVTTTGPGTCTVTADQAGDATWLPAPTLSSSVSLVSVSVVTSSNPAVIGQVVTFTATSASPIGTLRFYDGTTLLGTKATTTGSASIAATDLVVGAHAITASFTPRGTSTPVTSPPLTQEVDPASTQVMLTMRLNPQNHPQRIKFTATIERVEPASGNVSGGSVTFFDNGLPFATKAIAGGLVILDVAPLGAGSHQITASFSGSPTDAGSTSAVVVLDA